MQLRLEAVPRICAEYCRQRAGPDGCTLVGITGAQGSGKTTLAGGLAAELSRPGERSVVLSLDDFYLPRAERHRLSRENHHLLATRGVPGTHDMALLDRVLAQLRAGSGASIPVFDKAVDDRVPRERWRYVAPGKVGWVLLEGWCVGVPAQRLEELDAPVNWLEREEDPDRTWRIWVNQALAVEYRALWESLDLLVMLRAPGFSVVESWREEQEAALEARSGKRLVAAAEMERFVAHFERLTRHALRALPERADLLLELDEQRRVLRVTEGRRVLTHEG